MADMLELLHIVEGVLPHELNREKIWKSLLVDYHPPTVERLWFDNADFRAYLHRIHPCGPGEALSHPHPWPSAMKIISGHYEMCVGYGKGLEKPPVAATLILGPGSEYEMTDPDAWHYVRPLETPSLSLMVTGKPWERPAPKSDKKLGPLEPEAVQEILQAFRAYYL